MFVQFVSTVIAPAIYISKYMTNYEPDRED